MFLQDCTSLFDTRDNILDIIKIDILFKTPIQEASASDAIFILKGKDSDKDLKPWPVGKRKPISVT